MSVNEQLSSEELDRRKRWFDGYVRALKTSVHKSPEDAVAIACPCCRNLTLGGRGGFEICPVCFWEDDGQDDQDASLARGGPNGTLSLVEARKNFLAYGACDESSKRNVRPPTPREQANQDESTSSSMLRKSAK
jgi:hypothetical protein